MKKEGSVKKGSAKPKADAGLSLSSLKDTVMMSDTVISMSDETFAGLVE